jgi:pSer/pThr/pTyr-binding forkhead associated (FHA) protein
MIPFDRFVSSYAGKARAAFNAEVRDPHLVLWTELDDESDERPTAQFLTMSQPLRPTSGEDVSDQPQSVLPLRKREGSNAFTLMVTIGRASNNDLVLADRRVSKFHAYFRRVGTSWTISDANSTNGTRVDGVPVPAERSIALRSGARIVLGGAVVLEFLEGDDLFERLENARPEGDRTCS